MISPTHGEVDINEVARLIQKRATDEQAEYNVMIGKRKLLLLSPSIG